MKLCIFFLWLIPWAHASELSELLALSYQNNPGLKVAEALVEREQSLMVAGMTPGEPMLGLSTLERRGETRYGIFAQKIRFPLKYYWEYKTGKHRVESRRADLKMKKFEIRGEIIFLYYSIYSIQNILRITRANIQALQEFSRIAEKKYASGQSSQGDSMKAHVELTRLELSVIDLVQEEEAMQARLKAVINDPQFKGLNFSGKTLPIPRYNGKQKTAMSEAPLLKKEFFLSEEARVAATSARWDFLPDVQLQYQWRLSGEPTDSRIYSFKMTFPLWFWKKSSQSAAAAAYKRAGRYRFIQEEKKLTAQIKDWEGRTRANARALKIYTTGLIPQAQGAYNLAKAAYRANKTSFLNLLDSERSLYRVQTGFYRSLSSYVKSISRLEAKLGARVSNLEEK